MNIKDVERKIRNELIRIRQKIKRGDDSEIAVWIIPNKLACSQRPLRDHPTYGGYSPLPPEARHLVVNWVEKIIEMGIRSIICLLEKAQHERYYIRGGLGLSENGLLGYYEQKGFFLKHFPLTDYRKPSINDMAKILEVFNELPKPVLIHCSAGIDRTTPVAAFIVYKEG